VASRDNLPTASGAHDSHAGANHLHARRLAGVV
jgi:hypothetical protein